MPSSIQRRFTMITAVMIHFEFLHRQYLASGRDHAGIVVVTRRAPREIASRIVMLLNTLTADEIRSQLLYI